MQFLVKGKIENNNYLEKMAQITLEKVKKQIENNSDFASTPIIEYGEKNMTDYSYSKGMLFFYILYHTVGEKAFFDAIVESIDDEIVVLDPFKSNKLIKHIPQNIKVKKCGIYLNAIAGMMLIKKTQELLKGIKVK